MIKNFKFFLPFFLLVLIGCSKKDIKYEVSGTSQQVSITISNEDNGTSQFSEIEPPWSYSFSTKKKDQFLYVSARNQTEIGNVTVSILKDGKTDKTTTSEGAYVIATVSSST